MDVGADPLDPARAGLLTPQQIHDLVESVHENSGGTSRQATGTAAANVDLYQVNCTFYDALARDDRRYLLARAVQLLTPGVPQVYYVGLLAGSNDMERLARTGVGRDVNRHHYTPAEVEGALGRAVVAAQCRLIRLRNEHPAFGGRFACSGGGPGLTVRWDAGDAWVELRADVAAGTARLAWSGADGASVVVEDLLALAGS